MEMAGKTARALSHNVLFSGRIISIFSKSPNNQANPFDFSGEILILRREGYSSLGRALKEDSKP